MAPKVAMKLAMKVIKDKVKAKAGPSSPQKGKAVKAAKAKPSKVNKKSLGKIAGSEMGLDEKIAKLRTSIMEETGAIPAATGLTKLDRSNIWSQAKTAMKGDQKLADDYAAANGKVAKGRVLLAWKLDPSRGKIYNALTQCISSSESVTKAVKWESMTALLTKFSAEEIAMHLQSGRITERECPDTAGVWEYKDNKDIVMHSRIDKSKKWTQDQQNDAVEDDLQMFDDMYDQAFGFQDPVHYTPFVDGSGKGRGKGPQLAIKGKGKGKGKNLDEVDPAEPVPEADLRDASIHKCKNATLLLEKTIMSIEEDMVSMKETKYWTQAVKKAFAAHLEGLTKMKKSVKEVLAKKDTVDLEKVKKVLTSAAENVKAAQQFVKEHTGLMSSKRSSSSKA